MRKKGDFAIGVACAIFAFVLTMQLKSAGSNTARSAAAALRNENLQALLYAEQDKTERLSQTLIDYSEEIERLRKTMGQPGGQAVELAERVESLEVLSGVSAMEGPGIGVRLEILPPQGEPGAPAGDIGHMDILEIANTLWKSGAEAVAINGSRMIVSSFLETQKGVVIIDGTPLSPPFSILAIGDAQSMKNTLFERQGTVETFLQWGIKLTVDELEKVEVPAYKGRIAHEYAVTR